MEFLERAGWTIIYSFHEPRWLIPLKKKEKNTATGIKAHVSVYSLNFGEFLYKAFLHRKIQAMSRLPCITKALTSVAYVRSWFEAV